MVVTIMTAQKTFIERKLLSPSENIIQGEKPCFRALSSCIRFSPQCLLSLSDSFMTSWHFTDCAIYAGFLRLLSISPVLRVNFVIALLPLDELIRPSTAILCMCQ